MNALRLLEAGLLALVVASATNWLALIPWRCARNRHWTERARLYHPVQVAAVANLWVLPAVLTIAAFLVWRDDAPHWALTALVTALGTLVGTIPMDREVFPRIPLKEVLWVASMNWLIRFSMWFCFLGAVAWMPDAFDAQALGIGTAFLILCYLWNHHGWAELGRKLGWLLPPPERLVRVVRDTAARMNVPSPAVWVLRTPAAQAFAMPGGRRLLFTPRLLELLADDELASVSGHELAHLTEVWSDRWRRYSLWLVFFPWVFFKPVVNAFGLPGFGLLVLTSVLVPRLYRRLSRRLEVRADDLAKANEPDAGVYAQALLRICEDNLVPAVHSKAGATHPHLYDRLLAAGFTPDFPRPKPAASMAWHGHLFSAALGVLGVLLVTRLVQHL